MTWLKTITTLEILRAANLICNTILSILSKQILCFALRNGQERRINLTVPFINVRCLMDNIIRNTINSCVVDLNRGLYFLHIRCLKPLLR